jgi:phage tail-like protein
LAIINGGLNVSVDVEMNLATGVNAGVSAQVSAGVSASASSEKAHDNRKDPYFAYNFKLEIDGITAAGFSEISGLGIQTDVEKKNFGGENNIEYKFIKATKYNDLTLKHGLIDLDLLWSWYQEIVNGNVSWRNATIYLYDPSSEDKYVEGWHLLGACPIKWDGPTFNASNSTVATETLVLTYHKLVRSSVTKLNAALSSIFDLRV